MAQLHFYVPDDVAEEIRLRAEQLGLPVSRWLALVVRREIEAGWPEGWFDEVVGGWKGGSLVRPEEGEPEDRDPW